MLRVATRRPMCLPAMPRPKNDLHRRALSRCGLRPVPQEHEAWKPATLDHGRFFPLDKRPQRECDDVPPSAMATAAYTCYGCHEHTPAKVRREHVEEGIQDFENCVECHRSAEGEPARRGGGGQEKPRSRERD